MTTTAMIAFVDNVSIARITCPLIEYLYLQMVLALEQLFIPISILHKHSVHQCGQKKSPNVFKSCPKMISLEKW